MAVTLQLIPFSGTVFTLLRRMNLSTTWYCHSSSSINKEKHV
uniref:Uncharacterized protein n=1 Tax=Rhizophora mucronata TaxID=61149 RepID=A0A2P2NG66_RHIMU